ncbi:hypothetical protein ACIOEW_38270 [Streptomyces sp. NPDC087901]|uniref:hypothetical protein n=1 Tax=unclassified Streptomyces TaxID=2593676 RepID=UPI00343F9DDF
MRKTTTTPRARRLAASAIALGTFLALALPAASAGAAPADPVRTVFFDDSYTANFGAAEAAGPAFLAQTMFSSTVHST